MKDSLGFVHLDGLVRTGSTDQGKMFTLPTGYRPVGKTELVGAYSNKGAVRIDINSSGEVQLKTNATSNDFISLSGIIIRSAS